MPLESLMYHQEDLAISLKMKDNSGVGEAYRYRSGTGYLPFKWDSVTKKPLNNKMTSTYITKQCCGAATFWSAPTPDQKGGSRRLRLHSAVL